MGFLLTGIGLMFGSPFGVIIFGAGIIVGYLLSENQRNNQKELDQAYDELNEMLLEREGRIDKLEEYIDQLHRRQEQQITSAQIASPTTDKPDDLTKIEGIGPKTAALLQKHGITTYHDLAGISMEKLEGILTAGGGAFLRHGHETWAGQAQLAAKGDWKALKAWQES